MRLPFLWADQEHQIDGCCSASLAHLSKQHNTPQFLRLHTKSYLPIQTLLPLRLEQDSHPSPCTMTHGCPSAAEPPRLKMTFCSSLRRGACFKDVAGRRRHAFPCGEARCRRHTRVRPSVWRSEGSRHSFPTACICGAHHSATLHPCAYNKFGRPHAVHSARCNFSMSPGACTYSTVCEDRCAA